MGVLLFFKTSTKAGNVFMLQEIKALIIVYTMKKQLEKLSARLPIINIVKESCEHVYKFSVCFKYNILTFISKKNFRIWSPARRIQIRVA